MTATTSENQPSSPAKAQPAEIQTQNGVCVIDSQRIHFTPSALSAALGSTSWEATIESISSLQTRSLATTRCAGITEIITADSTIALTFAPRQSQQQEDLATAIKAAQDGKLPTVQPRPYPGLHFAAVDVETANSDWGSICQVGVVVVNDGHITDTHEWLCTPPTPVAQFDELNISIHGITAEDVADAPTYAEIQKQLVDVIGELPVVAHNAQFDLTALQRAATFSEINAPELTFGCSLAVARHAGLNVRNHRLPTLTEFFGIELSNHHRAGADAAACAGIVLKFAAQMSQAPSSLAQLLQHYGLDMGQLKHNKVRPVLQTPASRKPSTQPSSTPKKKPNPKPRWAKAATPDVIPEANLDADPSNIVYGQHITLSGDFAPFDKGTLWNAIAALGGTVAKNVTKKTTVLASGPWESKTTKLARAEELIAKGQDLEIWSADELFQHLGLNPEEEQPPF